MADFEKILTFADFIEADILSEVLLERKIPHEIVPYANSTFIGIGATPSAWGYLRADGANREIIMKLYQEIRDFKPEDTN